MQPSYSLTFSVHFKKKMHSVEFKVYFCVLENMLELLRKRDGNNNRYNF